MAQPSKPPKPKEPHQDKVPAEPGFQRRLADMYKKVLHTPAKHRTAKKTEGAKPR
jgi:hypothetical protein